MKKTILFVLIFSALAFSKVNAQQMYSDPNFLKCALHLYNANSYLDEAYHSDNQDSKAQELLPDIQKNVNAANQYYQVLKTKYSTEKDFKTFEESVQAMQKSCEFISQGEKNWIMLYTLVKINLQDWINQKIK